MKIPSIAAPPTQCPSPQVWPPSSQAAADCFTHQELSALQTLPRPQRPTPMMFLMDTGFDVDDETALLVATALHRRGVISMESVVTTTDPADGRARLTKGALKQLGLGQVPVAVGDPARPEGFNPQPHRLQAPFVADASEVGADGVAQMRASLAKAEDHSLVLMVVAKMTDAASLLKSDEALFQQKVKQVVLMGGVQQKSENNDTDASQLSLQDGFLVANNVATNNRHDQPAADAFYRRLQELDVKVKVVTRKAATNTPISPDFFKDLNESGHAVAGHLRTIEGDYLNNFYLSACQQQMGPGRDKAWFIKTFCKEGTPADLPQDQDIRPYLKSRVLYDAIAVLAGVDEIAGQQFDPVNVKVGNTTHELIGLSQQVTGLRHPEQLAWLLSGLSKEAVNGR